MIKSIRTRMLSNGSGTVACKMSMKLICGKTFNEKAVYVQAIEEYVHQQWYFLMAKELRRRVERHVKKSCDTCAEAQRHLKKSKKRTKEEKEDRRADRD